MKTDKLYSSMYVEFYDKLFSERYYLHGFSMIRKNIKKHLPGARTVLELACGSGRFTKYFLKDGFVVKAVDISKDALSIAKKNLGNHFIHGNMMTYKSKQKYDVVVCLFDSIRYNKSYETTQKMLKNIFWMLNENGLFIFDFSSYPPGRQTKPSYVRPVKLSNGKIITMEVLHITKGNFDTRKGRMIVNNNGKMTTEKIYRAPLLRFTQKQMEKMIHSAGFRKHWMLPGFEEGNKNSSLFIVQK